MQRLRKGSAFGRRHRHPIAMQCHVDPAFGAKIRMRAPGDIAEQARCQPQAPIGGAFAATEQPVHPVEQHVAMFGKAPLPHTFLPRRDNQRVELLHLGRQLPEQQAFTQAEARGNDRG